MYVHADMKETWNFIHLQIRHKESVVDFRIVTPCIVVTSVSEEGVDFIFCIRNIGRQAYMTLQPIRS
jgi:hypothetical protein